MSDKANAAILFAALSLFSAESAAQAQTSPPDLRFEVASVRIVNTRVEGESMTAAMQEFRRALNTGHLPPPPSALPVFSGPRVTMAGIAMRDLIAIAYRQDPELILGQAGNSLSFVRYAIRAIMPDRAERSSFPTMLRSLLEERFHLKVHEEVGEHPGYSVMAAKSGLRLPEPRTFDLSACAEWVPDPTYAAGQMCSGTETVGRNKVETSYRSESPYGPWKSSLQDRRFRVEFFNIDAQQLALYLGRKLSSTGYGPVRFSPVRNGLGEEGRWDLVLENVDSDPATVGIGPDGEDTLMLLSAALSKLGLRLEHTKVQAKTLVVDRWDITPLEN